VIRPEPFDGNSSIKKWLQKYEVCTQAKSWNSGEMAVQLLPLLSGTAFDFAMKLPSEEQKSYNALMKRLLLEFEAPGLQQSYALEFSDHSRRPGESLTVFYMNWNSWLHRPIRTGMRHTDNSLSETDFSWVWTGHCGNKSCST